MRISMSIAITSILVNLIGEASLHGAGAVTQPPASGSPVGLLLALTAA